MRRMSLENALLLVHALDGELSNAQWSLGDRYLWLTEPQPVLTWIGFEMGVRLPGVDAAVTAVQKPDGGGLRALPDGDQRG